MVDSPKEKIERYFDDTYRLLEKYRKNKYPVLVHCRGGVSRSATIVIAYLMKKKKMNYNDAFSFVSKRRKIIQPNNGFERKLRDYEKKI